MEQKTSTYHYRRAWHYCFNYVQLLCHIRKSKLNTNLDRLTISMVAKGTFQETIPVNGTVAPQSTIYLDAFEGGVVEEKYIQDGTIVTKGQPILRLSTKT